MSCLYILEINPLSVDSFANIFSHSEGCLLVLFMVNELFMGMVNESILWFGYGYGFAYWLRFMVLVSGWGELHSPFQSAFVCVYMCAHLWLFSREI